MLDQFLTNRNMASDGAALRLDAATVEILRSPGRV
jgi:hypothetical protein